MTHSSTDSRGRAGLLGKIWFEIFLSWRFMRSNFLASVFPCLFFTLGAWHQAHARLDRLPIALAEGLVYSWLFIYVHELFNQINGVEEDRINKPSRPIPSGLCTEEGARKRVPYAVAAFVLYAALIGAVWWSLLWVGSIIGYHVGGHKLWHIRILYATTGAVVFLGGGWAAGYQGPETAVAWTWYAAMFLYWTGVGCIQDQRDVEGDRLVGRRTLPIVIGDRVTRILGAAFLIIGSPASVGIPLLMWSRRPVLNAIVTAVHTIASWYLSACLVLATDDRKLYQRYSALSAIPCATLLLA